MARPVHLVGIQSLRGFAALIVVLCHIKNWQGDYYPSLPRLPAWIDTGIFGVDLFFIISGFIITYVNFEPLSSWRRQGTFLLRRVARIYPAYWAVVIPIMFVGLVSPSIYHLRSPGISAAIPCLLLLPYRGLLFLVVAWTLVYEIYFYLVTTLAYRWDGRFRLALLLAWVGVIVMVTVAHPFPFSNPYVNLILSPLCLEFIAGALLAYLIRSNCLRIHPGMAAGVTILAFGYAYVGGNSPWGYSGAQDDPSRVYIYGVAGFFIVWMVLQMELQGGWRWVGVLAPMGDRSYSMYLLHVPFTAIVFKLVGKCFPHGGTAASFTSAFLALAGLVVPVEIYYRWVEKPSHEWARKTAKRIETATDPMPSG